MGLNIAHVWLKMRNELSKKVWHEQEGVKVGYLKEA